MDCTIVICTHNRADSLQRCLESLQAAASPEAAALEVLVVANACSDHTIELLARWSEQGIGPMIPLRWVEESRPGKSHALNQAIAVTGHSKALAFVDDDHLVQREYLQALTDALSHNPNFDLYCGVIQPAWDGSEPAWVHEQGEYRIPIPPVPSYEAGAIERVLEIGERIPGGGNLIVRRALFERVGGFAAELGPTGHNLMGSEDRDFIERALNRGSRILYAPAIKQYHAVEHDRMTLSYMLNKSYQRSYSVIKSQQSISMIRLRSLLRKLVSHALRAGLSLQAKRRFYWALRLAATYGELRATLERRAAE